MVLIFVSNGGILQLKENVSLNQRIANGLPIRKGSFVPVIPKSVTTGEFSLIDFDGLVESTKSSRLHNFVNVSNLSYDIPITKSMRFKNKLLCQARMLIHL